jgi:signal transduction histidine kinase
VLLLVALLGVSVSSDGAVATLRVRDRGRGIAPGDQKRIFLCFERAVPPSEVSGLGVGLHIVTRIVEAHGGSVRVDSKLGEGSTFIVDLPVGSVARAPHAPGATFSANDPGKTRKSA